MKKSTAAATAIVTKVESERPGFWSGNTEAASVHVINAKTTSQLQWIAMRNPRDPADLEALTHGTTGEVRSPAKITSTLSPS